MEHPCWGSLKIRPDHISLLTDSLPATPFSGLLTEPVAILWALPLLCLFSTAPAPEHGLSPPSLSFPICEMWVMISTSQCGCESSVRDA